MKALTLTLRDLRIINEALANGEEYQSSLADSYTSSDGSGREPDKLARAEIRKANATLKQFAGVRNRILAEIMRRKS